MWGQPTIFCGWDAILQDFDRNLATSYSNDKENIMHKNTEAAKQKKSILIKNWVLWTMLLPQQTADLPDNVAT